MPVAVSYPGVYIEEIPSGVRTITGVATSITAFIGRALRGPVNRAVTINSLGDFERIFGGLWVESTLGYAVRDFYLNGGSQGIIVRLFHPFFADEAERLKAEAAAKTVADAATAAADGAAAKTAANAARDTIVNDPAKSAAEKQAAKEAAARINSLADDASAEDITKVADASVRIASASNLTKLAFNGINLQAAYQGTWGTNLRATVDKQNISADVAGALGVNKDDVFNLTVSDTAPNGPTERFVNLTVKESARRIDRVLAEESRLVRWEGTLDPASPPAIAEGSDPVTTAEHTLADARRTLAEKRIADPAANVDAEKKAVDDAAAALDTAKKAMADGVSDGGHLTVADFLPPNGETEKKGLFALEQADLFNLLCIPPYSAPDGRTFDIEQPDILLPAVTVYCEKRRAMLLVDPPSNWDSKETAKSDFTKANNPYPGIQSKNAALFFPRLKQPNPLRDNQVEEFAPCGAVSGIFARTDTQRGVWKAPAGLEANLVGVPQLNVNLTDPENGELNPLGINCLRAFPVFGRVVWGARTLRGADQLADEWKYIPVRRTALFIEESLYRGTKWVVFEPNDEPLWAQIRLNIGAFMQSLFRQGAFQGRTPREAYFVKCDKETTTPDDINKGIVNIIVGFAPLKPAEFVILKIQQMAGEIPV